jgi:hypothetical protein
MRTIPEATLASWTKPAFDNEDQKREYTERAIYDAINGHVAIKDLPVNVYAKGSFKNNTNVRRDSDVDVAVEYTGIIYTDYAEGVTDDATGLTPYSGGYPPESFKDHVGEALCAAFGASAVTRHNKVFTVRESNRSLAADVVPCFTHRWYYAPGRTSYEEGIRLIADKPTTLPIDNFPQQHYDNGCAKNNATSRRFKRVVRILKRLENKMVEDGVLGEVASYLIESLVHNVPNDRFRGFSWGSDVRAVLLHIWEDTEDVECEKRWFEANRVKFLFHWHQKWDRDEARNFVWQAWQYVHES